MLFLAQCWKACVAATRARGGRHRQLRRAGRERPGAVVAVGAGQGRRDVHVGQHVLDRLERADRPAERHALQRIVAGHLQRPVGAADLLEGDQHRGAVEHLARSAASPRPPRPAARPARPVKVSVAWLRVGSMVSTASRVTPGPFRSTRNSETPRASAPGAVRAATIGEVGDVAVGDRRLDRRSAGRRRAASWIGLGRHRPGLSARAKVPIASPEASFGSQRAFCASRSGRPAGTRWPGTPTRRTARAPARGPAPRRSRTAPGSRGRGRRTASGIDDAEEAHLGQTRATAPCRRARGPPARARTAAGGHLAARNRRASVAQLLLFVGKLEIHQRLPVARPAARTIGAASPPRQSPHVHCRPTAREFPKRLVVTLGHGHRNNSRANLM